MSEKLSRCLNFFDVFVYGVGIILGAGIYFLIGSAAGMAGNLLWFSFIVAGAIAALTALSYAELSSMYPSSAAAFTFVSKGFNSKFLGWLTGFLSIIVCLTGAAAVAIGFANYAGYFINLPILLVSFLIIALLSALNYWGIRESANFNIFSTFVEAGGLLIIIFFGANFLFTFDFAGSLTSSPLEELAFPVVSAAALIFFAFIGFEDIANLGEETVNAHKVIPTAILAALVFSTLLYILVSIVSLGAVGAEALASSTQPLASVMDIILGGPSGSLLAVIALFATANTVLVMLVVVSRIMYGMAKEKILPTYLSKVSQRRKTPVNAVLTVLLLASFFLIFSEADVLASMTNVGIFIIFFFVNAANIILRIKEPNAERPFKIPLSIKNVPVISALACISCIAMIFSLTTPVNLLGLTLPSNIVGIILALLGIPFYFILRKK
jgi:basic amino acid/polyamine antiporter, APA family